MHKLAVIAASISLSMLLSACFTESTKEPVVDLVAVQDSKKQVLFYPSYAYQKNGEWIVPLRVWVYKQPDAARIFASKGARNIIRDKVGLENLSQVQKNLFQARAHGFIADSESREKVIFAFDNDPSGEHFKLRQSTDPDSPLMMTDKNGLIDGYFRITPEKAKSLLELQQSKNAWLSFHAISKDHGGIGKVRLVDTQGLSVISDIDDTIKVTEINAGEATVLNNTFFKDFIDAPCMSEMYNGFAEEVSFHYVSGGPWQMYAPLAGFLFNDQTGFPLGSFHMKNVRTNLLEGESYHDFWRLHASGSKQVSYDDKVREISTLMTRFPERKFILIGDTGEKDPEVFSYIKFTFPEQVQEIRIRDVINDKKNNPHRIDGMVVIPHELEEPAACQKQSKGPELK